MRTTTDIRAELSATRGRISAMLTELHEAAIAEAGGLEAYYTHASLYGASGRPDLDPEGCGACRGTGTQR